MQFPPGDNQHISFLCLPDVFNTRMSNAYKYGVLLFLLGIISGWCLHVSTKDSFSLPHIYLSSPSCGHLGLSLSLTPDLASHRLGSSSALPPLHGDQVALVAHLPSLSLSFLMAGVSCNPSIQ